MEWDAVDALLAMTEGTEWEYAWHLSRLCDAHREATFGELPWADVAVLAEESARMIVGPDGDTLTGDIRRCLAEVAENALELSLP
jgi:hypothetical protein